MIHSSIFKDPEYIKLKEERSLLSQKRKEFETSFGEMIRSGKAFFSYSRQLEKEILNYNGFKVWADYCDGRILIMNWHTDQPHKSELHFHKASQEILMIEEGEAILHLEDKSILLGSEAHRNTAYLFPGQTHTFEITSSKAKGYAILIPPDPELIATKDKGCIYKNIVGTCYGNSNCPFIKL